MSDLTHGKRLAQRHYHAREAKENLSVHCSCQNDVHTRRGRRYAEREPARSARGRAARMSEGRPAGELHRARHKGRRGAGAAAGSDLAMGGKVRLCCGVWEGGEREWHLCFSYSLISSRHGVEAGDSGARQRQQVQSTCFACACAAHGVSACARGRMAACWRCGARGGAGNPSPAGEGGGEKMMNECVARLHGLLPSRRDTSGPRQLG